MWSHLAVYVLVSVLVAGCGQVSSDADGGVCGVEARPETGLPPCVPHSITLHNVSTCGFSDSGFLTGPACSRLCNDTNTDIASCQALGEQSVLCSVGTCENLDASAD
jgi:hypothetical protein